MNLSRLSPACQRNAVSEGMALGLGGHANSVGGFHEVNSVTNSLTMTRIRIVSQRGQYQQSNSAR
jgi:hypothetical protein